MNNNYAQNTIDVARNLKLFMRNFKDHISGDISDILLGTHYNDIIPPFSFKTNLDLKIIGQPIYTDNNGTISNLDSEMMVEVPCRVGSNGVEALSIGEVPSFYKGLLENQFAYEKLTVDANLEGSYQKALQALILNRTVINTNVAKELLNELIEANKGYWPELK